MAEPVLGKIYSLDLDGLGGTLGLVIGVNSAVVSFRSIVLATIAMPTVMFNMSAREPTPEELAEYQRINNVMGTLSFVNNDEDEDNITYN